MISSVCLAQVEQGAITGAVIDSTGASIPKAKVTATNQATGVVAGRKPPMTGTTRFRTCSPVSTNWSRRRGSRRRVTDVPVLVGQIATINVTLKPGSVHDEVTVTSNAVMVDQVSSSLGYVTGVHPDPGTADRPQPLFADEPLARRHRHG